MLFFNLSRKNWNIFRLFSFILTQILSLYLTKLSHNFLFFKKFPKFFGKKFAFCRNSCYHIAVRIYCGKLCLPFFGIKYNVGISSERESHDCESAYYRALTTLYSSQTKEGLCHSAYKKPIFGNAFPPIYSICSLR